MSTDDWALEMIPRPVHAVLMLFPVKAASEAHRHEEAERVRAAGATHVIDPATYFTKQIIDNACGTIGILVRACGAGVRGKDRGLLSVSLPACGARHSRMQHAVANLSTLTGGHVELKPGPYAALQPGSLVQGRSASLVRPSSS